MIKENLSNTNNKGVVRTLNSRSDLTQGSIWKHIINISIPAIIGQMFNSLYNLIDTYWGGKVSTEALAAFSLTFPVFLFAIALGQCFAAGGMVLVSNSLGKKNFDEARTYYIQSVLNAALAGIILSLLIILLNRTLLSLLGVAPEVLEIGVDYLSVLAIGVPFLMVNFALNVGLMSQGNTRFMRNIMILNALINFGLDPLLLFGWSVNDIVIIPAMGIKGIALATVLVQALGVLLTWIKVQRDPVAHWRSDSIHKIEWPKFDFKFTKEIITYGIPTFLQISLASFGIMLVNYFMVKIDGSVAVAGYGIGLRIEQMALVPSIGIGMALSALVGQNNGANNPLRIRESYIKSLIASAVLWIGLMLPVAFFGTTISSLFTEDFKVVQIAYFYLSFAFMAFMGYQILGSASGVLQGMKQPKMAIIFLCVRQLVLPWIFIPIFAYWIGWGIYGVFMSVVVSVWISGIIVMIITIKKINRKIREEKVQAKTM